MSDQEFKNYVALISKLLHLKQGQQESIGGELKDHLQTRVADLIDDGVPEEAAFQQALEEFGDAAAMARNFQSVLDLKRRRWMMRFTTLAVAGAFLAAVFTMAMWPAGARFGAPASTMATTQDDRPTDEAKPTALMQIQLSPATKSDLATEKALEQLTDLHYESISFADVMKDLGDRLRLNFMLDESAKNEGLSEDQEMTIRLSQVPLSKGLMLMLREYSVTYIIDEGIVRLISIEDSYDTPFLRMKMFDCKALSRALPKPDPKPLVLHKGGGVFGGGGGGGVFRMSSRSAALFPQQKSTGDKKQQDTKTSELKSEKLAIAYEKWAASLDRHLTSQKKTTGEDTLLELVRSMVDPDWENSNGQAQAKVVNGVLVVTQNETNLRKIDQLLTDLRGQVLGLTEPVAASDRPVETSAETHRGFHPGDGDLDGDDNSSSDPFDG